MKNSFTFKKILPSLLIVIILSVGIFGAFGVGIVEAQNSTLDTLINLNQKTGEFIGNVTGLKYILDPIYGGYKIAKATECFSGDGLRGCVAALSQMSMEVFAWILGLTGIALNQAIKITVLSMGANIKDFGVIEEGWKIFRDLANILIIFSLLFI